VSITKKNNGLSLEVRFSSVKMEVTSAFNVNKWMEAWENDLLLNEQKRLLPL
jgi:hypothetical protein